MVGYSYWHTCRRSSHNILSTLGRPDVIREYLAREYSEGSVLGPLDPSKLFYIHISQFEVIPKGSTVRRRLNVDMSSPEVASVNGGIPEELRSLSYGGVWTEEGEQ